MKHLHHSVLWPKYRPLEVPFKDDGFLSSCGENEDGNFKIEHGSYYREQRIYNLDLEQDLMLIIVVKGKLPALQNFHMKPCLNQ